MNVLVCGADGFLGRHIVGLLVERGHGAVRGVRQAKAPGDVQIDYRNDLDALVWEERLIGIDAVVNAVGILRERQPNDFELIHHQAPSALFDACARKGIRRVVQISALGDADTAFMVSKRAADADLKRLVPKGIVVKPGLVFGSDGASTKFFLALASLPIHFVPTVAVVVQPIHVADLVRIIVRLVEVEQCSAMDALEAAGPQRLSYGDWMKIYRCDLLGLAPALQVRIPSVLIRITARIGNRIRRSPLTTDTWTMLRAGNVGDPSCAAQVNGMALMEPSRFVVPLEREALRLRALANWRGLFLRTALAIVWLGTALVSSGLYPIQSSLALLATVGLSMQWSLVALISATALDVVMGILTLYKPGRRLWQTQLAIVSFYTVLIAWRLPEYVVHPFGPLLKNVAVAALLVQLWAEERRS